MAITYHIDRQAGVVHTVATGTLTNAELMAHKQRLMNDPNFGPGMVELSDARGVEHLEVTADGVWNLALQDFADSDRLKGYKLAILVAGDVVYGMARMYQMRTEPTNPSVAVFRDLLKARQWLGLPA